MVVVVLQWRLVQCRSMGDAAPFKGGLVLVVVQAVLGPTRW